MAAGSGPTSAMISDAMFPALTLVGLRAPRYTARIGRLILIYGVVSQWQFVKLDNIFKRYEFPTQVGLVRIGDQVLASTGNENYTVGDGLKSENDSA